MSCRTVRPWLHVAAEQLSEPDRLVLEDHLQVCERCREERAQLALVRRLGATLPVTPLGPRGHARVIAAALIRGLQPAEPVQRRPIWPFAIAGAAVVAAIAIAVVLTRADEPAPIVVRDPVPALREAPAPAPARPAPPAPIVRPDRVVVEGELEVDGNKLAPDAEVPTNVALRARVRAKVRVFDTQVVLAAASQIIVRDRTIVVLRGSALVTPRDGVQRRIEAGDTWPREARRLRAEDELATAHAAYAQGDFARAEKFAASALASKPTVAQAAEAETVIADCRQATGAHGDAMRRYQTIATSYPGLAAGETASFAAARLAARTNPTEARSLYERYLARYPQGRFALDARRALEGVR
jgi:hypothetical protein